MSERTLVNAYRDPLSNAVVNVDNDGYQSARIRKSLSKARKQEKDKVRELEERIDAMENKFDSKLDSIIQLLSK